MDSFNIYKGYGHLDQIHLEDQIQDENKSRLSNPRIRNPIAITFIILLTLIIASVIGALIYHSQTEPHEEQQQLGSSPGFNSATHSIESVCNVTRYPDSCFSTLTSLNTQSKPDPESLFSLSLQAAMNEISKLASLPELLSSRVNDPRTQSALKDCQSLFNDAFYRLNQSAAAVKGHVASAPGVKISDINTWISAAMTDQDTCLDGLEEMESTVVDEVRDKIHGSKVYMSNTLAILANIKSLVEKFHKPVSGGHLSNNNHI